LLNAKRLELCDDFAFCRRGYDVSSSPQWLTL